MRLRLFVPMALILISAMGEASVLRDKQYLDMHSHVACYGIQSKCFIGPKMRESWFRYKGLEFLFGISEREIRNNGGDTYIFRHISDLLNDSARVESTILLAFDMVYNEDGESRAQESLFYVPNDFVAEGAERFDNLHFAASVHPYRNDAVEELERVHRQGAMFVKLIPSIQRFHPNHPKLESYWRALARLRLPVLIHLDDEGTFGQEAAEYAGAHKIERALELGVEVIAAHAATKGEGPVPRSFRRNYHVSPSPLVTHYEQLKVLAERYRNLSIDISALPLGPSRRYVLYDVLADDLWKGRTLYGSDFPLNHWTLQSIYYFTDAWDRWKENGVQPIEFWRGTDEMEQRWDRDIRLKEAFGVDEEVFLNSRRFFERLGRL